MRLTSVIWIGLLFTSFGFCQTTENLVKNGMRLGVWRMYYDAGKKQISSCGKYRKNVPRGKWRYYNREGKVIRTEHYRRKRIDIVYFFPNGKVYKKGRARLEDKDSTLHFYFYGRWKRYDEKGNFVAYEYYQKGRKTNEILNERSFSPGYNDSLAKALYRLERLFLLYGDSIKKIRTTLGNESLAYRNLKAKEHQNDSLVYADLEKIANTYGYPDSAMVGEQAGTMFFIISSAPWQVKEKFYLLFQHACNRGDISKRDMAYFTDKLHIGKEGRQIYGTQSFFEGNRQIFYPVRNLEELNQRRKEAGLEEVDLSLYKQ